MVWQRLYLVVPQDGAHLVAQLLRDTAMHEHRSEERRVVHPHVVVPLLQRGKLPHQLPGDMQDLSVRDEIGGWGGDNVKGTGHEFTGVGTQEGGFPVHPLNAVALQLSDVAVGQVAGKVDLEAQGGNITVTMLTIQPTLTSLLGNNFVKW